MTAYTAGLWENLSEQDRIALRELCFPLPKPKQAAASVEAELQPKQSIALTSMPPSIIQPIIGKPEDDLNFQEVLDCEGESGVTGMVISGGMFAKLSRVLGVLRFRSSGMMWNPTHVSAMEICRQCRPSTQLIRRAASSVRRVVDIGKHIIAFLRIR